MQPELSTTEDTGDTENHHVQNATVSSVSTVVAIFVARYHSTSGTPPR